MTAMRNKELTMAREMVRQGGRSARIQREVHAAARELLKQVDRCALTVPMIAEHAGVTPSTIYRRWGTIGDLLADVAVERLRPVSDPDDTGSLAGDLEAFVIQYAEEMSSKVGRALLRDVVAESDGEGASVKCCQYTYDHLAVIAARARERREASLDIAAVIDGAIAPICYHILFSDRPVDADYCRSLMERISVTRPVRETIGETA